MITIARENLKFYQESRPYTGRELAPHWILKTFGLRGTACVVFAGPCHVKTSELVDLEDALEGDRIESKEMLHVLAEFFGEDLRTTVLRQRLMVARVAELLGGIATRDGNDLYVGPKKLSVSIVTASPVSTLLHLGINIDPAGAPVAAIGLKEMAVNPEEFARRLLDALYAEWQGHDWACSKVRPLI